MSSTTDFWVYDVERGYLRLIDQVRERAEYTHYLYCKHVNITRIATGQPRLTKYTYLECWRAVNKGLFDPKQIKTHIMEAKKTLSESLGNPPPVSSYTRKRRDNERAAAHKMAKKSPPVSPVPPQDVHNQPQLLKVPSPVAFVTSEPIPSCSVSIASQDTEKSGILIAPVSPAIVYSGIEDAMLMSRLEEPENLRIAQMKITKHLLHNGEDICFPITDLSMDIALSVSGLPTDPDTLYSKLEQLAERRGVKFVPEQIYKDLKRAYGHVKFIPRLPSPECYQFSKY